MSFIRELKRRNVIKVAVAYIIVGWLIMQAGEVMGPALRLPDWINSALAFFLILGFPLAMIFAWAFELTADGIRKEKDVDRSESTASTTGKKLNITITIVLALALGLFAFDKFVLDPERDAADIASAVQVAQQLETGSTEPAGIDQQPAIERQSIAVLPFENRSNREEDQFFTDGMHDDLLTTIAKIGSMKVISRTSVMEYKDTIKKIPQIAKELGVANILEGGIQRSGNQVRINVQLIDAVTDEHLWAEIYDRELTAENLFAVQSEITKAIAEALHTALSPQEVKRIDTMATGNLQALEAYLRGRQLIATRSRENIKLAVELFNQAVELDPEFALAWVGVADSNYLLMNYAGLSTDEFFPILESAIQRALEIDENLGEAYTSLGALRNQQGQPEKADAAYRKSIQLSPNYATARQWYSHILARDPLRRNEALEMLRKAAELDPRSSIINMNLAGTYKIQGLYSLAERQYKKIIEQNPGFYLAHRALINFYNKELGRYDQALIYARKLQALFTGEVRSLYPLADTYLNLGDLAATEKILEQMMELDADSQFVGWLDLVTNLHKNNPAGAREALGWLSSRVNSNLVSLRAMGYIAVVLGDETQAREFYLAKQPGWLEPAKWPELIHSHTFDSCLVAWTLINTGDEELGQRLLQQSMLYFDETLPGITEHPDIDHPEVCYLTAGDSEKALHSIETQLAHKHLYDWKIKHQMPMYELIRHEPRFQAALAERKRLLKIQRDSIAAMDVETGL